MSARKRELIEPHKGDKRHVRRSPKGRFKEVDDVGRSLGSDSAEKSGLRLVNRTRSGTAGEAARSLFDLRTDICSNPRAGRTRFRAARGPLLGVIWPAGLLPHWVTSPSHPPSPPH
jgi:hypothetical protein